MKNFGIIPVFNPNISWTLIVFSRPKIVIWLQPVELTADMLFWSIKTNEKQNKLTANEILVTYQINISSASYSPFVPDSIW